MDSSDAEQLEWIDLDIPLGGEVNLVKLEESLVILPKDTVQFFPDLKEIPHYIKQVRLLEVLLSLQLALDRIF